MADSTIPTDEPFAFTNDYATSISQRGKIEKYAREGKGVPVNDALQGQLVEMRNELGLSDYRFAFE